MNKYNSYAKASLIFCILSLLFIIAYIVISNIAIAISDYSYDETVQRIAMVISLGAPPSALVAIVLGGSARNKADGKYNTIAKIGFISGIVLLVMSSFTLLFLVSLAIFILTFIFAAM